MYQLTGLHGEGMTVRMLFTLLFWDVIFCNGVVDVFYSRFQTSPLDLYTDNFFSSRRDMIEQRLAVVSESSDEVGFCFFRTQLSEQVTHIICTLFGRKQCSSQAAIVLVNFPILQHKLQYAMKTPELRPHEHFKAVCVEAATVETAG